VRFKRRGRSASRLNPPRGFTSASHFRRKAGAKLQQFFDMTKFFMLFLQKKCKLGDFYKKNRPEERFFSFKTNEGVVIPLP
jgi:hypothetical protein